jgi:hypothetical protein
MLPLLQQDLATTILVASHRCRVVAIRRPNQDNNGLSRNKFPQWINLAPLPSRNTICVSRDKLLKDNVLHLRIRNGNAATCVALALRSNALTGMID